MSSVGELEVTLENLNLAFRGAPALDYELGSDREPAREP
jgi:hypothetical protein